MAKIIDFKTREVIYNETVTQPITKTKYNFTTWDTHDLLLEMMKFQTVVSEKGYVSNEMIQWGKPLFTELTKKANTPEVKDLAQTYLNHLLAEEKYRKNLK